MLGIRLHKVVGNSMLPTISHGDFVVTCNRNRWQRLYQPGDIVVVKHSRFGKIIKRIVSVSGNGRLMVAGDNRASSTESSKIGSLSVQDVIGRLILIVGN